MAKNISFGEFLGKLAQDADVATADTLAELEKKMRAEKQAQIESKLRTVFSTIQQEVSRLREVRRQEKEIQGRIKDLEERANRIVAGTDDDEAGQGVRRVRRNSIFD